MFSELSYYDIRLNLILIFMRINGPKKFILFDNILIIKVNWIRKNKKNLNYEPSH
jgi:hypothetical protein